MTPFPTKTINQLPTGFTPHEPDEERLWLANFDSERTRRTYRAAVREFCTVIGAQSVQELRSVTRAQVLAYREHLLKTKNATHRTVRSRLAALSSLFQHLVERQVLRENPVHGIKRPRVNTERGETVEITPAQVRQLLDVPDRETLQGIRDRAILHVFFYTGCRISEISTLRVRDFFEDAGYFVLDFTVKGGKKNRVAIHPELTGQPLGLPAHRRPPGPAGEPTVPAGEERPARRDGEAAADRQPVPQIPPAGGDRRSGDPPLRPRYLHYDFIGKRRPHRGGAEDRGPCPCLHHPDLRQAQVPLSGQFQSGGALLISIFGKLSP
jgi:integrase